MTYVAATGRMEPTPVAVEDNGSLLRRTAPAARALLDGELRVGFRRQGAHLLRKDNRQKAE